MLRAVEPSHDAKAVQGDAVTAWSARFRIARRLTRVLLDQVKCNQLSVKPRKLLLLKTVHLHDPVLPGIPVRLSQIAIVREQLGKSRFPYGVTASRCAISSSVTQFATSFSVPEPNLSIEASRNDDPAVRPEGNGCCCVLGGFKRTEYPSTLNVPKGDCMSVTRNAWFCPCPCKGVVW